MDDDEELSVTFSTTCQVTPEALAWALMTEKVDAVDFIRQLDAALQNWDMTLELAEYFDAQRAIYAAEVADL